jgi:hypothetical protein
MWPELELGRRNGDLLHTTRFLRSLLLEDDTQSARSYYQYSYRMTMFNLKAKICGLLEFEQPFYRLTKGCSEPTRPLSTVPWWTVCSGSVWDTYIISSPMRLCNRFCDEVRNVSRQEMTWLSVRRQEIEF